jgi:hypothetical protein
MVYNTPPDLQAPAQFPAANLAAGPAAGGAMASAEPARSVDGRAAPLSRAAERRWFRPQPPPMAHRHYGRTLVAVLRFWQVARHAGILALSSAFPIGSGVASNLWAAVSDDNASKHCGAGDRSPHGIVSALGCLLGGQRADRMDRKTAYALYGLVAMCAAAMAGAAHRACMWSSR